MKRLLSALFLLLMSLVCEVATAQPSIAPSMLAPTWGYIRKAPCGTAAGDACGSNPPTWHLTPEFCGVQISTGAARNEDAHAITANQIGDGVTTAFAHSVPTRYANDLVVKVAGVTQTITTDYTVAGAGTASGTVTFVVAPAAAATVNIALSSFSNRGDRYTLPTNAEMIAAGRGSAAGAAGSTGAANREAQCQITFVMGAPGPSNYLRIGIDSVDPADKFTPFGQGAFDMNHGDIVFPYLTPGTITFWFDGVSWKAGGGSPAILEKINQGQQSSHGNMRLSQVSADPSWWSSSTLVGKLALCPMNGRGLVGNANGGFQLTHMPFGCVFKDNVTTSSVTDWIVMRNIVSGTVTGIAEGASYIAGTAPNGVLYPAGSYVVLLPSAALNASSGNTVSFYNLKTTSGVDLNGKWIVKWLSTGDPGCTVAPCMQLHERVDDLGNSGGGGSDASPFGPPSAYQSADALVPTGIAVHFLYASLGTANMATARKTNPTNGVEFEGSAGRDTIVGVARRTSGTGYQDTATNRHVLSFFNPVEKEVITSFSATRTFTNTVTAEINSEIRGNFVYSTGVSAQAGALGDAGRGVRWMATVTASNDTNGDGCQFYASFDNAAVETATASFTNDAGSAGGKRNITFGGVKKGLSETGQTSHYITLHAKVLTGGICTVDETATFLTAYPLQ